MPTVQSQPGLFDYGLDMQKAKDQAAPYGGTGGDGGQFSVLANETRQPGFAAQQNALDMYGRAARGEGQSAAEQQLRMQSGANQRAAYQMAAAGRGGNMASLQRQAMSANAGAQAQTNQQAALLRAQEQEAARAGYAQLGSQMYGQGLSYDQLGVQQNLGSAQNALDWYRTRRGLDLQESQNRFSRGMAIANGVIGGVSAIGDVVGGVTGGKGSDERMKQNIRPTMGEGFLYGGGADKPDIGARADAALFGGNPYGMDPDISFGDRMNSRRGNLTNTSPFEVARIGGMSERLGGDTASSTSLHSTPLDDSEFRKQAEALQGRTKTGEIAQQMGMSLSQDGVPQINYGDKGGDESGFYKLGEAFSKLSDERAKQVNPQSPMSATSAIGAIEPVSYEYKPGYGKPGERVGLLAQDLERTPAGAAVVNDTPYGKVLDVGDLASLAVAGQAESLQREKQRDAKIAQLEGAIAANGYGGTPYRPRGPVYAQGSTLSQQKVRNAA